MSGTAGKLTDELPVFDKQNGTTLGRILGRGTAGEAEEAGDGKMTATVRIPDDELAYDRGVVVLPHGKLELTLIIDDENYALRGPAAQRRLAVHPVGDASEGAGGPASRRPGRVLVRLPY